MKIKNTMDWLNLATEKDLYRQNLRGVYSDGECIMATDGHRMHKLLQKASKGYVDPTLANSGLQFPDCSYLSWPAANSKLRIRWSKETEALLKWLAKSPLDFSVQIEWKDGNTFLNAARRNYEKEIETLIVGLSDSRIKDHENAKTPWLNPQYLLEAILNPTAKDLYIGFTTPKNSVTIWGHDSVALIMPIRL